MNQVFDLNRWLLLTGKHWSENRKKYLLSLIAVASLLLTWFSFMMMLERESPFPNEMQVTTFYVGLFLTGGIYGSVIFSDLSSTSKAINYLSIPASAFEKLLVALFYGLILFFVCYTIIFYLIDIPMVQLSNNISHSYWLKHHDVHETFEPEKVSNVFSMLHQEGYYYSQENKYLYFVYIFIVLQSAYILGSVYFKGYSAIKTTVALMVLVLFVVFLVTQVVGPLIPKGAYFNGFTSFTVRGADGNYGLVKLPDWIESILLFLFKYAGGPILWIVTYFRLKEKEV